MELGNKQEINLTLDDVYNTVEMAVAEEAERLKRPMLELIENHDIINKNLVRVNLQLSDILVRLSIIENNVV